MNARKTIFRSRLTGNFTALPNEMLCDKSLSFEAKGMLAVVFAHGGRPRSKKWLISQSGAGRDAVTSILNELEISGNAEQEEHRDSYGRFLYYQWRVFKRQRLSQVDKQIRRSQHVS